MAKKVVASLRDKSGVKYAKLIQSVKSEKSGSYSFKEEIIIENHVKDILAGKSQQDIINELRAKEKEAEAAKIAAEKEAAEAPKEEKREEAPAAEAPKEEKKEEAPAAEAPKEEKKEEIPAAEAPKEEKKEDGEAKS